MIYKFYNLKIKMANYFEDMMKERLESGVKYKVIIPKRQPSFDYDVYDYKKG